MDPVNTLDTQAELTVKSEAEPTSTSESPVKQFQACEAANLQDTESTDAHVAIEKDQEPKDDDEDLTLNDEIILVNEEEPAVNDEEPIAIDQGSVVNKAGLAVDNANVRESVVANNEGVVVRLSLDRESNVQFNYAELIEKNVFICSIHSASDQSDSESDAKSKAKKKVDENYDTMDPFIDDEELFVEEGVVLSKEGFFVYFGPLIEEGARVSLEKADGSGLRRSRAGKKNALTRGGALGGGYERLKSKKRKHKKNEASEPEESSRKSVKVEQEPEKHIPDSSSPSNPPADAFEAEKAKEQKKPQQTTLNSSFYTDKQSDNIVEKPNALHETLEPIKLKKHRAPIDPPPEGTAPYGYKKDGTPRKIARPKIKELQVEFAVQSTAE